jgi:hypothetical protein
MASPRSETLCLDLGLPKEEHRSPQDKPFTGDMNTVFPAAATSKDFLVEATCVKRLG